MDDCQHVMLKEINMFVSMKVCSIVINLINTSTRSKRNEDHGMKIQKLFFLKKKSLIKVELHHI